MPLNGPILIVENDEYDNEVLIQALKDIGVENEAKCFEGAQPMLTYLKETTDKPFVILCDIDMPGMNGLELRKAINDDDYLRRKSIPFIFYTGMVSSQIVDEAYDLTVQGFIEKPSEYRDLQKQLQVIIGYWKENLHPNSSSLRARSKTL